MQVDLSEVILTIRIHAIRKIVVDSNKPRHIYASGTVEGNKRDTAVITLRRGESSIEFGPGGVMRWDLTNHQFSILKSSNPKLRIHILCSDQSPNPASIGFLILDTIEFQKGIKSTWFRLHGSNSAEVNVTVSLQDRLSTSSPTGRQQRIHRADASEDRTSLHKSLHYNGPELAASTDSALSLTQALVASNADPLRLLRQHAQRAQSPKEKFAIKISIEDFADINAFLKTRFSETISTVESELGGSHSAMDKRTFWFSWIIFGQTFQTLEFSFSTLPDRVADTIHVRCPADEIASAVATSLPFQFVLCSTDRLMVASAAVDFSLDNLSIEALRSNSNGWKAQGWFPIVSLSSIMGQQDQSIKPSVKIGIEILAEQSSQRGSGRPDAKKSQSPLQVENSTRHTGTPPIFPTAVGGTQTHNAENADEERENQGDIEPSANDTYDDDQFEGDESLPVGHEDEAKRNEAVQSKDLIDESVQVDPDHAGQDESLSDEYLRHFRVTVDVRSVQGLRRPTHFMIAFTYPHLGSSAAVRTVPVWALAHVETRFESASATYECCMSRAEFRATLRDHPLRISVLSRSHLGTSHLGDVVVDLGSVLQGEVHSVRDPLSSKTFKSPLDYARFRRTLVALRGTGSIDRVPPVEPVVLRLSDSFLGISPVGNDGGATAATVDGAKLRIVTIVEDIGAVGPEVAVAVKKGYQMQHGGLYDHIEKIDGTTDIAQSNGAIQKDNLGTRPLSEILSDLASVPSNEAKQKLLGLMTDWEEWQRVTESSWREKLREEERAMRKRLEAESAASLAQRADDLRRGQEEAGRLEIRLREKIDAVDRHASQLVLKEEKMNLTLAQKAEELQLLQRRVRDEARIKVDVEARRAEALEAQIVSLRQQLENMEKRAKESERDFESYRHSLRSSPEHVLREEVARLKATLGECRAEVERERRKNAEVVMEKEHFRAQMHRLALALKREREMSAAMARQDVEQLRLEFLAREERYTLDGDRDELNSIRKALASLHTVSGGSLTTGQHNIATASNNQTATLSAPPSALFPTHAFPLMPSALTQSVPTASLRMNPHNSSVLSAGSIGKTNPTLPATHRNFAAISAIKGQIDTLLATGLYTTEDSAIIELLNQYNDLSQQGVVDPPHSVASNIAAPIAVDNKTRLPIDQNSKFDDGFTAEFNFSFLSSFGESNLPSPVNPENPSAAFRIPTSQVVSMTEAPPPPPPIPPTSLRATMQGSPSSSRYSVPNSPSSDLGVVESKRD